MRNICAVFPTYVGVFLYSAKSQTLFFCFPHVRGGVSLPLSQKQELRQFSPRTWGCFSSYQSSLRYMSVFPTYVGVFLHRKFQLPMANGFPHVRGGVSTWILMLCLLLWFSPRTWGCFSLSTRPSSGRCVFPTYVGVFLAHLDKIATANSFPHVRGGVSSSSDSSRLQFGFSPRTWGCFQPFSDYQDTQGVFPTYVGVFGKAESSHRTIWRFPTYVGVFPSFFLSPLLLCGFPHVRGGVSTSQYCLLSLSWFSPRTWWCFSRYTLSNILGSIFSI